MLLCLPKEGLPMRQGSSLVIRGGTIIDGTGRKPFVGDVAVGGEKIVEVGTATIQADEEINATGLLVTPGFVDIHTHYDAQAIWSNRLDPSSWNGVTTVMMSNCGVGFAPCKPHERDILVALMEGVEDIPEVVMTEGLSWDWETFPDFLNRLAERQYDVDIVTQVPHAAIRVYVMGRRGADLEPATDEDRREMARLVVEGIEAGALGFSTSNAIAHKTLDGKPTPTLAAAEEELAVIAEAVGETGKGWVQIITDFDDPVEELTRLRRVPLGTADEPHPCPARRQARPLEAAARHDRGRQQGRRQAACADHGQADRHQFRLRDLAQSVLRAAELQGDRPFAVRGAAAAPAGSCIPSDPSFREDRRPGARTAPQYLGSHLRARQPAELRATPRGEHEGPR